MIPAEVGVAVGNKRGSAGMVAADKGVFPRAVFRLGAALLKRPSKAAL